MTSDAVAFVDELAKHYALASRRSFPAFLTSIERSTPINSAPYLISLEKLLVEPWCDRSRRMLLEQLVRSLWELRSGGIKAEVAVLGGSFLRLKEAPNDLDLAIFYSKDELSAQDLNLTAWQHTQARARLDVRLLPIDVDPAIVLKLAIYFGILYSADRDSGVHRNGCLIVDCSRLPAEIDDHST